MQDCNGLPNKRLTCAVLQDSSDFSKLQQRVDQHICPSGSTESLTSTSSMSKSNSDLYVKEIPVPTPGQSTSYKTLQPHMPSNMMDADGQTADDEEEDDEIPNTPSPVQLANKRRLFRHTMKQMRPCLSKKLRLESRFQESDESATNSPLIDMKKPEFECTRCPSAVKSSSDCHKLCRNCSIDSNSSQKEDENPEATGGSNPFQRTGSLDSTVEELEATLAKTRCLFEMTSQRLEEIFNRKGNNGVDSQVKLEDSLQAKAKIPSELPPVSVNDKINENDCKRIEDCHLLGHTSELQESFVKPELNKKRNFNSSDKKNDAVNFPGNLKGSGILCEDSKNITSSSSMQAPKSLCGILRSDCDQCTQTVSEEVSTHRCKLADLKDDGMINGQTLPSSPWYRKPKTSAVAVVSPIFKRGHVLDDPMCLTEEVLTDLGDIHQELGEHDISSPQIPFRQKENGVALKEYNKPKWFSNEFDNTSSLAGIPSQLTDGQSSWTSYHHGSANNVLPSELNKPSCSYKTKHGVRSRLEFEDDSGTMSETDAHVVQKFSRTKDTRERDAKTPPRRSQNVKHPRRPTKHTYVELTTSSDSDTDLEYFSYKHEDPTKRSFLHKTNKDEAPMSQSCTKAKQQPFVAKVSSPARISPKFYESGRFEQPSSVHHAREGVHPSDAKYERFHDAPLRKPLKKLVYRGEDSDSDGHVSPKSLAPLKKAFVQKELPSSCREPVHVLPSNSEFSKTTDHDDFAKDAKTTTSGIRHSEVQWIPPSSGRSTRHHSRQLRSVSSIPGTNAFSAVPLHRVGRHNRRASVRSNQLTSDIFDAEISSSDESSAGLHNISNDSAQLQNTSGALEGTTVQHNLSPDPVAVLEQVNADEMFARLLQAQFDAEANHAPPINQAEVLQIADHPSNRYRNNPLNTRQITPPRTRSSNRQRNTMRTSPQQSLLSASRHRSLGTHNRGHRDHNHSFSAPFLDIADEANLLLDIEDQLQHLTGSWLLESPDSWERRRGRSRGHRVRQRTTSSSDDSDIDVVISGDFWNFMLDENGEHRHRSERRDYQSPPRRRRGLRSRHRRHGFPAAVIFDNLGGPDGADYEALLEHAERMGDVKRGLSRAEINRLPTRIFNETGASSSHQSPQCHICMSDYETDEKLRILPCFHDFHAPCIDRWLKDNNTCPICRVEVEVHQG